MKKGQKIKKTTTKRRPALRAADRSLLPVCAECGRSAPVHVRTGLCVNCELPWKQK